VVVLAGLCDHVLALLALLALQLAPLKHSGNIDRFLR